MGLLGPASAKGFAGGASTQPLDLAELDLHRVLQSASTIQIAHKQKAWFEFWCGMHSTAQHRSTTIGTWYFLGYPAACIGYWAVSCSAYDFFPSLQFLLLMPCMSLTHDMLLTHNMLCNVCVHTPHVQHIYCRVANTLLGSASPFVKPPFPFAQVSQYLRSHNGSSFKWKDYSPLVFQRLRQLFGIDNMDYLLSLTGESALRLLASPGKSGSAFFLSEDDRFLIKTVQQEEMRLLLELIPKYYRHVEENSGTLLTRFHGLHMVKPVGRTKATASTRVRAARQLACNHSSSGHAAGSDPATRLVCLLRSVHEKCAWRSPPVNIIFNIEINAMLIDLCLTSSSFPYSQQVYNASYTCWMGNQKDHADCRPALW